MGMEKLMTSHCPGNEGKLPSTIAVSSLICHRDVLMALTCLGSFLKHCQQPVHFILHDDGSLQEEDIELLSDGLHSPTIVAKSEADAQIAELLEGYPNALQFRRDNIFAMKLFDTVHFNTSNTFAYCDTDIYFFRPLNNPFLLPNATRALFLRDNLHPYSIKLRDFLTARDIKIVQHVNAGMISFCRSYYDLDLIEWYLSKRILHGKPYFVEQTIWALLGQYVSCRLWKPSQIAFMTSKTNLDNQLVAGHFVTPARHLLEDCISRYDVPCNGIPAEIGTMPSKRCSSFDLAWFMARSEIARKLDLRKPQQKQ